MLVKRAFFRIFSSRNHRLWRSAPQLITNVWKTKGAFLLLFLQRLIYRWMFEFQLLPLLFFRLLALSFVLILYWGYMHNAHAYASYNSYSWTLIRNYEAQHFGVRGVEFWFLHVGNTSVTFDCSLCSLIPYYLVLSRKKSLMQKYCWPTRFHLGVIFRHNSLQLCRPDEISHPDDIHPWTWSHIATSIL